MGVQRLQVEREREREGFTVFNFAQFDEGIVGTSVVDFDLDFFAISL